MKSYSLFRAANLCLTVIGLISTMQTPLLAQPISSNREREKFPDSSTTAARIVLPELPPIQPILPDIDEIRLELKLSERRVYVYRDRKLLASYPVAIGRPGYETPIGTFEVTRMVIDPAWTFPDIIDSTTGVRHTRVGEFIPPGIENPLGSRWIGFATSNTNAIGFHGTSDLDSIGKAASHGCIRMYNADIKAMFELVQIRTPVVVQP
jgi:L,D-transpeptidase ErfK/SrfK